MAYPSRTRRNYSIQEAKTANVLTESVWLAGRVIGLLDDGFVLQDESGRVLIRNEELRVKNEEVVEKNLDSDAENFGEVQVGDIVEVRVERMKNEKLRMKSGWLVGEKNLDQQDRRAKAKVLDGIFKAAVAYLGGEEESFMARELNVLASCLEEFFIRKQDPNYLKMIVDLSLKERLIQRTRIFQKIREFFSNEGFVEADAPVLVRLPGMEPYLDVFKTRFFPENFGVDSDIGREKDWSKAQDMYLATSPEYALKKLLVAGFEKVYQLAKSFRNKETDSNTHNPEFTLLEWYRAYASYLDMMVDVENLVDSLAKFFHGSSVIPLRQLRITNYELRIEDTVSRGEVFLDVKPPWTRMKVRDAFREYAGVSREDFEDVEKFRKVAQSKGYKITAESSFDDIFFIIFMNEIERKLGFDKPVILYDYPVSMAALSKVCENDPKYAERFEVYVAGMELANSFSELNDPFEQEERLKFEQEERRELGKEEYSIDQSFLRALRFGMPPAGGIALGVDRLVMLLTDTSDIRNAMFFPQRDL